MAKDILKVLRQNFDHIYIKESTDGNAPSFAAADEIGYVDDAMLSVKAKKVSIGEGGGADIQTNVSYELAINAIQILDSTTLLALTNKNVFILVVPSGTVSATNQEILLKNFLINTEETIDAKAGAKNFISITGKKSEFNRSNVYVFNTTATAIV
ncbi:MAG: hypothetical protein WCW35_14650 [Bacteroidota bacterium]|jgi:hypothetical protein